MNKMRIFKIQYGKIKTGDGKKTEQKTQKLFVKKKLVTIVLNALNNIK